MMHFFCSVISGEILSVSILCLLTSFSIAIFFFIRISFVFIKIWRNSFKSSWTNMWEIQISAVIGTTTEKIDVCHEKTMRYTCWLEVFLVFFNDFFPRAACTECNFIQTDHYNGMSDVNIWRSRMRSQCALTTNASGTSEMIIILFFIFVHWKVVFHECRTEILCLKIFAVGFWPSFKAASH